MLRAVLMVAFCATAAFAMQCSSNTCNDGTDNVLHFNDCGGPCKLILFSDDSVTTKNTAADVKFQKVLALTYKQDGTTPYCNCNSKTGKMEGSVNFPGVINIKDVEVGLDEKTIRSLLCR